MDLFRLYAYNVVPQKNSAKPETPAGGAVKISAELRATLAGNIKDADFSRQPGVVFVHEDDRSNEVRELILAFGFGEPSSARAAAAALAQRLSAAMDNRSQACLFVPSAFRLDHKVRVILWLFPREPVFRLTALADEAMIEVLNEVFSQKSRHKKAASYEGRNTRSDFLGGRVLDLQANNVSRDVAEYWISRFLRSVLSIQSETGTRLLAKTLREAHDAAVTPRAREGLHSAIVGVRTAPRARFSLRSFAGRFLDGEAADAFLDRIPDDETGAATFDFHRETFDKILQFVMYELKDGVYVSSPFGQVGDSVRITKAGEGARVLSCKGEIIDEKLRTRHA